jgi:hypothetical protein
MEVVSYCFVDFEQVKEEFFEPNRTWIEKFSKACFKNIYYRFLLVFRRH